MGIKSGAGRVGLIYKSLKARKESKAANEDKQANPSTSRTNSKGRGNSDRKLMLRRIGPSTRIWGMTLDMTLGMSELG